MCTSLFSERAGFLLLTRPFHYVMGQSHALGYALV